MRRFFAPVEDGRALLKEEDARHLLFSLRAEAGEELEIVDRGRLFEARIASTSPLEIVVTGEKKDRRDPIGRLSLIFSPLKNGREEFILQKGTELGASLFIPYIGERTVVRPSGDSAARKLERYRAIVKEASSQCRRESVPEVLPIAPFSKAVMEGSGKRLFADEELSLTGGFALEAMEEETTCFVGPEGGIAPKERKALIEAGFAGVSLGKRILRSETAAVAFAAFFLAREEGK